MSPPNEEATMQRVPMDAEMKETNAETQKPDAEMTSAKPEIQTDGVRPDAIIDGAKSKLDETAAKPDAVMEGKPLSTLERHGQIVSTIRAALNSDVSPEKAAHQALQATSSHPDRDKILLSSLHTILPTVPLETAFRLLDMSTHLPYVARNTISLIEALTTILSTGVLSTSLPLIQRRINTVRMQPKSEIFLIKLLRSLISRDEHAANPVLVGRLKLLLASALPPWHRSGMNLRGKYNKHMIPTVPTPSDASLARALKAFADACRYPPGCEQRAGWNSARDGLKILLDAFGVGKLVEIERQICVQAGILLQHLEFDGGTFGKSLFGGGEGATLRRRVWDRLDPGFKRFFMVLLQRERRWVRWKKTMEHTKGGKVEIAKVFKRRVIWRDGGRGLGVKKTMLRIPKWKSLKERTCGGGVKTLIEELKEDQKEAEEDRRKGDGRYVWRGLRSLCEENVSLMAKVADNEGKVDVERILSEKV